jgi:hypothetical protein
MKTKTKTVGLFGMTMMIALLAVPVFAVSVFAAPWETYEPYAKGQGKAGKSDIYHGYLVQKEDFSGVPGWTIVEGGAWGKLTIKQKGEFVFNGHGLVDGTTYELIIYKDPWPGDDSVLLGTGTADEDGNVHIKGDISLGTNDKIWLVLSADFDEDETEMIGWSPVDYLFEYDVLP